ncbi:hypothetical protein IHV25_00960 [Phaeovibrio sulfidiphilus]|uniref:Uncharacterized protein n=1 Tax=Phaeovibrio sulfidiphilus TaxID=1220600 RepID=A0A8J7CVF0_9PROT|nr:hypothetical protein [Phaeovibrio sulfidiphilus]MBE1236226.1 hypothetical protein [Phaeovibrio sulfidiphilus]
MIDAQTGSGGGLFSALRSIFGEADRAAPETAVQDRRADRQIQAGATVENGDPVDEVLLSPDARQRLARLQAGGNENDPGWNAGSRASDLEASLQETATEEARAASAEDRSEATRASSSMSGDGTAAGPASADVSADGAPSVTAAGPEPLSAPLSAYRAAERLVPPAAEAPAEPEAAPASVQQVDRTPAPSPDGWVMPSADAP